MKTLLSYRDIITVVEFRPDTSVSFPRWLVWVDGYPVYEGRDYCKALDTYEEYAHITH